LAGALRAEIIRTTLLSFFNYQALIVDKAN
jgi:hypothetical protein